MRYLLCCFSLFLALMPLPASAQPEPKHVYRFAPIPMASEEEMLGTYLPFLNYLEQETGVAFELNYFANYADLLTAFNAGEVDLAYLGPLPYVVLSQQTAVAEPIVQLLDKNGESQYTCAIVRFASSPEQVNASPKVALTQPLSTCGYLAMENYFQSLGRSLENTDIRYSYTGSHEKVALEVILGHFDLGGMKTQIAERYHHLGLRVVDETRPVPGFILVSNRNTLPTDIRDQIRARLLALKPLEKAEDRLTVQGWSHNLRYGATEVDLTPYSNIEQQLQQLQINLIGEPHEH